MRLGYFFLCLFISISSFGKTVYFTTNGDLAQAEPEIYQINDWDRVIDELPDHSEIHFLEAEFKISTPLLITNKKHIKIYGYNSTIDGQKRPQSPVLEVYCAPTESCFTKKWTGEKTWIEKYINMHGFSSLIIDDSKDIEIYNLNFKNSWPNAIEIKGNSNNILIEGSFIVGGTNAIFAHGTLTHDITLKNNHWIQDPSGEIWSKRDWQHVHHGLYNYFNGAFFQAKNISGQVTIEFNLIEKAYNAVRMKINPPHCIDRSSCLLNTNVNISNNLFYKIADNVVEPEYFAANWTMTNNTMEGVYAPFSFDSVYSKNILITKNHTKALELPRAEVSPQELSDGPHQGSRLFKFSADNSTEIVHKNFQVLSNVFNTRLINASRLQRFTDVESLTPTTKVFDNHFCDETPFNQYQKEFPEALAKSNDFDI